jgi:hypothetical protein
MMPSLPINADNAISSKFGDLMRRASLFRKTDVIRATKAVLAAGVEVARVQIEKDGTINIIAGSPEKSVRDDDTPDDLKDLI